MQVLVSQPLQVRHGVEHARGPWLTWRAGYCLRVVHDQPGTTSGTQLFIELKQSGWQGSGMLGRRRDSCPQCAHLTRRRS